MNQSIRDLYKQIMFLLCTDTPDSQRYNYGRVVNDQKEQQTKTVAAK